MKNLLLLLLALSFLVSCADEKIDFCEEKINETKEEKKEGEWFCGNPAKRDFIIKL